MDQVIPLFPTPVMHVRGLVDTQTLQSFNEDLAKETWFRNKHTDLLTHTEVVNPSSNKLFLKLRKLVVPKITDFGEVMFGEKLNWTVKEMWVNVMHPGGFQATHSHANSFVSAVIYLTDCDASNGLIIHRNGGGGLDFVFNNSHENMQHGPYNAAKWQSPQLAAGDMLLFPSYMLHEVPMNRTENKRVSLAMNAIPDRLNSWGYQIKFSK
ncbi:MAG: putative 2OG-Fe(II) oxygenase [Alphaproteobacteria bacterium]